MSTPKQQPRCALLALIVTLVQIQQTKMQSAMPPTYNDCYGGYCFTAVGLDVKGSSKDFMKTQSDAVSWCISQGMSLVTVDSADKHEALKQFLFDHEYTTDSVWIAAELPNKNSNLRWINGILYTGIPIDVTMPKAGYIDASNGGQIDLDSYTAAKAYVCQFKGNSLCEALEKKFAARTKHSQYRNVSIVDVVRYLSPNDCYIAFPIDNNKATKQWPEARLSCQNLGGDLLVNNTIDLKNLSIFGYTQFWIGVQYGLWTFKTNSLGEKTYSDSNYYAFSRDSPMPTKIVDDSRCIALSFEARYDVFSQKSCSNHLLFVCEPDGSGSQTQPGNRWLSEYVPCIVSPPAATTLSPDAIAGVAAGCFIFYLISIAIAVLISCFCNCHKCRPTDKRGKQPRRQQANKDYNEDANDENPYKDTPGAHRANVFNDTSSSKFHNHEDYNQADHGDDQYDNADEINGIGQTEPHNDHIYVDNTNTSYR